MNRIKTALPTIYELVRIIRGVPCRSTELVTQERELILTSPERNQLKLAGLSGRLEAKSKSEVRVYNSNNDDQFGKETRRLSLTEFSKRMPEP